MPVTVTTEADPDNRRDQRIAELEAEKQEAETVSHVGPPLAPRAAAVWLVLTPLPPLLPPPSPPCRSPSRPAGHTRFAVQAPVPHDARRRRTS